MCGLNIFGPELSWPHQRNQPGPLHPIAINAFPRHQLLVHKRETYEWAEKGDDLEADRLSGHQLRVHSRKKCRWIEKGDDLDRLTARGSWFIIEILVHTRTQMCAQCTCVVWYSAKRKASCYNASNHQSPKPSKPHAHQQYRAHPSFYRTYAKSMRRGSWMYSLTFTKKVAASLPSMSRWS